MEMKKLMHDNLYCQDIANKNMNADTIHRFVIEASTALSANYLPMQISKQKNNELSLVAALD